jgi:hypothetical protein
MIRLSLFASSALVLVTTLTGSLCFTTACGNSSSATGATGGVGVGGNIGAGGNGGASSGGGSTSTSPFCLQFGQNCDTASDCCSGLCDPASNTCASSINQCTAAGGPCQSSTECCTLACTGGKCNAASCIADDQSCTDAAACCGGNCDAGICHPLNTACRTGGNPCTDNAQCCSSLCSNGTCKLGASFCIQTGDVCSQSSTCCSGDCQLGSGTLGICGAPPSGATNCSDGVDGTVCSACNGCCSRLCAPYAPTGVNVCQPASGCRVNGNLCRRDSDCCGAAGTGLPGDGNVTCEIDTGKTLGICRNPQSCNPQGDVCHYKNYVCDISSARNDCCAAVGNSGVCQLDSLGVPRCNGLGTTCRQGGESCSSAMDCCNQVPCVPDATGALHCYSPPDGGTSTCVPAGGSCSINGDCCPGSTCIEPLGSTQGVCGTVIQVPDAGTPDDASTPVCSEYGQTCTISAECCNAVPCWNGKCMYQVIIN